MGKCQYSMGLIVYTSLTIMKCDGNTSIPGSRGDPWPCTSFDRSAASPASVRVLLFQDNSMTSEKPTACFRCFRIRMIYLYRRLNGLMKDVFEMIPFPMLLK